MSKKPVLSVNGLSKTFPEKEKPACNNISFDLYPGEITALIGENGAGKSTLVNMITGELSPDSGTIFLNGRKLSLKERSPSDRAGIGLVHQHPELAEGLPFFTNIIAGKIPPEKIIRKKKIIDQLEKLAEHYRLDIPLLLKAGKGTLLQQQNAELLSILQNDSRVIIIDEPAALLEKEWEKNFLELLSLLQKEGRAILLISHKIGELLPLCHHILSLKQGKREPYSEKKITGRDIPLPENLPKREKNSFSGKPVLECRNLSVSDRKLITISGISFSLFPGEILAIEGSREAGLNIMENLFTGMISFKKGEMMIGGIPVKKHRWNPSLFRKMGGAAIPAHRMGEGCIPSASVSDNQIFSKQSQKLSLREKILSKNERGKRVEQKRSFFSFEGKAFQPLNQLSGGNIQRVIIARELDPTPEILVISEPSRGLDNKGRDELFSKIINLRNNGCAILLLSADFNETQFLADRILRIRGSRIEDAT